jgi:hypothetical protein
VPEQTVSRPPAVSLVAFQAVGQSKDARGRSDNRRSRSRWRGLQEDDAEKKYLSPSPSRPRYAPRSRNNNGFPSCPLRVILTRGMPIAPACWTRRSSPHHSRRRLANNAGLIKALVVVDPGRTRPPGGVSTLCPGREMRELHLLAPPPCVTSLREWSLESKPG